MTLSRSVLLTSGVALALCGAVALKAGAQGAAKPMMTLQMPALPQPAAVTLKPATTGLLLKGKAWGRPNDEVGLAGLINGLSDAHKDYLAAGGIGFIIGDGRLNY